MSIIKFNNQNRLYPWTNNKLKAFLGSDDFFNNDFFEDDNLMPAMNIKEHENDFEIEFAAPGFSKQDFEVTIKEDVLNVCGEKSKNTEEKEGDYTCKEFSYNSFKRSLKLPNTVNTDNDVKATYINGILKLNLLKKEGVKEKAKKVIKVV